MHILKLNICAIEAYQETLDKNIHINTITLFSVDVNTMDFELINQNGFITTATIHINSY